MTRPTAVLTHLATLCAGGTGLVYAWVLYLAGPPEDEFALVNHPWQPEVLAAHVLTSPLLVFACGFLWPLHVLGKLRAKNPERRRTGLSLALLVGPMVASGYLLQVTVAEGPRQAWVVLHVASSILWLVTYGVHLCLPASGSTPKEAR